jgi:hypothetical protein
MRRQLEAQRIVGMSYKDDLQQVMGKGKLLSCFNEIWSVW